MIAATAMSGIRNNQSPNPDHHIITKHQTPITKRFGDWLLVIEVCLVFGIWCLVISSTGMAA